MVKITIGKVRVKYCGVYEHNKIYNKLDAVYYNGATWISLYENNKESPNNITWKQSFINGKDLFKTEIISNKIYDDF